MRSSNPLIFTNFYDSTIETILSDAKLPAREQIQKINDTYIWRYTKKDRTKIKLHKLFYLVFIELSRFNDLGGGFNRLARVDLSCFGFCCFFN